MKNQMTSTSEVYVGVRRLHSGGLIAVAIVGVILGVIGVFWPQATLFTIAILFGIYLIASGIFRIMMAVVSTDLSAGMRWFTGLMGLLVIVAGIICLSDPFTSITVLAFVIGIGWIAGGVVDIVAGVRRSVSQRWLAFVSGTISVIAGFAMFVLPVTALAAFVVFASILLIVVSVATLLMLPRARTSVDSVTL